MVYNNNLLADGDNQGGIGDSGQSGGTGGGGGNTEPCTDDFPCVSEDLLGMLIDSIM